MSMLQRYRDVPRDYDKKRSWKSDKLGRKTQIEPLEQLLLSTKDEPLVLAIDSGWGTGKSLLLKMWSDDLIFNQKHPCVLIDAWKTDFAGDPFVPFALETIIQLSEQIKKGELKKWIGALTNLRSKVSDAAKASAQKGGGAFAAACASYANPEMSGILAPAAAATCEEFISKMTEKNERSVEKIYFEHKAHLQDFEIALKELIQAAGKKRNNCSLPIIIFVDELDRCRPHYAMALLERIKHLFSVPGIVFVLATDIKQLAGTVHSLYGLETNSCLQYLRRFIDLDFVLPDPKWEKLIDYICKQYNFYSILSSNKNHISDLLEKLATHYDLSARDMVQVSAQLGAIISGYKVHPNEFYILAALAIIRKKNPTHFEKLLSQKLHGLWNAPYGTDKIDGFVPLQGIQSPQLEALALHVSDGLERRIREMENDIKKMEMLDDPQRNKDFHSARLEKFKTVKNFPLNKKRIIQMLQFAKPLDL